MAEDIISSCNLINNLNNIFINNCDNTIISKSCTICSLIDEKNVCTMHVSSIELNAGEISLHNKLDLCCPELDLRINSKASLCTNCFQMVSTLNTFIRKCYTSKVILHGNFPIAFPSLHYNCDVLKEIKEEELDLSLTGSSTNMETSSAYVHKTFNHSRCNYNPVKEIKLINNIRTKHFKSNFSHICMNSDKKLFNCSYCDYNSNQKKGLKNHLHPHTGEKPFKCLHCDYRSNTKHHLLRHLRTHTGEKPFKCSECNYGSNSKECLISHIHIHTGEKLFKCLHCNYSGNRRVGLINHLSTHTGDKPFKCSHCDYSSSRKYNLIYHVRTHTGEKPFKCSQCEYRGRRKQHLVGHIRTHTGEKPFKCLHCDHRSSRKQHLIGHIRSHTGDRPFKCSSCEYSSTWRESLVIHLRTHMGENP